MKPTRTNKSNTWTSDPTVPDPGLPTVLYVASSNPGKLREFREAAESHGVVVEALP